jgi:hypothetical protein
MMQKLNKSQKTIEEKRAQLDELPPNLRTDLNISWSLAQSNRRAQQAQAALKSAEDLVSRSCTRSRKLSSQYFRNKKKNCKKRFKRLKALQQEHDQLAAKIQSPAFVEKKAQLEKRIKNPDQPVTGSLTLL